MEKKEEIKVKRNRINVLVLGSGARENAIALSISKSKLLKKLFISSGNYGTELLGENVSLDNDFSQIKKFVIDNDISLVVVGGEQLLVDGIWDYFKEDKQLKDVLVVGPSKKGASLEGSKAFAKSFMKEYNIPTAKSKTFTKENIDEAFAFLETMSPPYVLKADGLAAGKGVLIVDNLVEAKEELNSMLMNQKFGNASEKVVIEQYLDGIECSCFVLTDGKNYKILPFAKDYKRIGENNTGLNTGGMGAVSPVVFCDKDFVEKVEKRIILPTIKGLEKEKIEYQGFIFIGLMSVNGEPYVIEYNVRMGDPETEVVFPRIKTDILELFLALKDNKLNEVELEIGNNVSVCVVLASKGYPEKFEKGYKITGMDNTKQCTLFYAGVEKKNEDLLTNGGRVIVVSAKCRSIKGARRKCYSNIENILFNGKYYRRDIGEDLMEIEQRRKENKK